MSSRTYKAKRTPTEPEKPIRLPVIERPRHNPSQGFQDALLGEIKAMCARIEENHIAPTHIMAVEVDRMVKDALNELYHRDLIDVGHALNDRWIKPTEHDAHTPE